MKKSISLITLALTSSACNLMNMSIETPTPSNMVCLTEYRGQKLGNPFDHEDFNRLTFADEFNGKAGSNEPDECFDDDSLAVCKVRMDINHTQTCDANAVKHLKNLNKCRWTIWDGYSIWAKSNLTYRPSQIKVEDGVYSIDMKVRPASEGPFQCGATHRDQNANGYYDTNCPVLTGGIESNYHNPKTKGVNLKSGRVEIKYRFNPAKGSWPALWLWAADWNGPGFPYDFKATAERNYIPETDILEATPDGSEDAGIDQTYHMWFSTGATQHFSPPMKTTPVVAKAWHTAGVERRQGQLRFYIGDQDAKNGCYTRIISDGDTDSGFKIHATLVDPYASFLMMNLDAQPGATSEVWPTLDDGKMEIDWVRIYE